MNDTTLHLEGIDHRFLELPGLRMHVAEAGSGEAVLLLHGFPEHWWEWRKVIPGLAEHYRVICPDLRGAGLTEVPADGYDRTRLLADVIALLDELDVGRVNLIGHDWGALLGFELCLQHPERVGRFISLATPHPYIRFTPRLLTVMWRLWFQLVIITPGLGPRLLSRGRQRFTRHLLRGYAHAADAWTEADIEAFLAPMRDPARARAGSALYRGFILPGARRIVSGGYRGTRLTTPTLVLYGEEDPGVRAEFLDGYQGHADDVTLEAIEGSAHFIPDEQPELVVERALAFFGAAPARA